MDKEIAYCQSRLLSVMIRNMCRTEQ